MESKITIRPITPADKPHCGPIVFIAFKGISEKHNFPPDFPVIDMAIHLMDLFAGHPNIFGVVAEHEGRVVGSNFMDERDAIRAVGPITVDPAFQGRGAGRKLMQAVIDRGRNYAGVRLVQDAFNTISMSLYTSLGFDFKESMAMLGGTPKLTGQKQTEARPMRPSDLDHCSSLCRRIHGIERTNELRDAIKMFNPIVLIRAGRLVGYASAPQLWALNHGVAETEADMLELIAASAESNGGTITLLIPIRQGNIFRSCLAAGLKVIKPMNLMAMGQYHEPRGPWYPSVGY